MHTHYWNWHPQFITIVLHALLPIACSNGAADETTGTTGTTETTGSSSSSGPTGEDGADSTTGEPTPPPTFLDCQGTTSGSPLGTPLDVNVYTVPVLDDAEVEYICPDLDTVRVYDSLNNSVIYLPDTEDRVPLLLFSHGNIQSAENYEYLFTAIAEMGIAVISVDASVNLSSPGYRTEAMACALSWAAWDDEKGGAALFQDRLTCDLILGGHSNGGEGAWNFLRDRLTPELSPYWYNFLPRALFTFGTRHKDEKILPPSSAVPYYALLGAVDEDTRHEAVTQYDGTPTEEVDGAATRILHLLHGVGHNDVGGAFQAPFASNVAQLAAQDYVTRFLDWQVLGQNIEENRRFLLLEEFASEIVDPDHWTGVAGYGELLPAPEVAWAPSAACSSWSSM